MRNKETGEFELVVGDRQLLSGFFIGVLLLAVVFAMGYVLGQNSPHSIKTPDTASASSPLTPQDARPQPASPGPTQTSASDPNGPVTMPVTPPGGDDATKSDTPPATTPPAEPPPQPTTQPAKEATPPTPPVVAAPPPPGPNDTPGTFWQVSATTRSNADAVLAALREKGLPASLRSGPKNLTLVWVGPYSDKSAMGAVKSQLEKSGFTSLMRKP